MARPRQALIDRARLVESSLRILDTEGTDALTMQRIAQELGVRAPSLYHHVGGINDVVALLGAHISEAVTVDPEVLARADPVEIFCAFGRSYLRALLLHPALVPLLIAQPMDVDDIEPYEEAATTLCAMGDMSPQVALEAILALEAVVFGTAILVSSTKLPIELVKANPTRFPTLASAVNAGPRPEVDDGFDATVEAIARRYLTPAS